MKVEIEVTLLKTVELETVTPATLREAKDDLCSSHSLEDCDFTARWLQVGHQRRTVRAVR